MDAPRTIIIHARYEAPPPPTALVLPTLITRYDVLHGARKSPQRRFVHDSAEALTSAITSWKHSTDFLASVRGGKLLAEFRRDWSNLLMAGRKPTPVNSSRPEWKGFLEATLDDDQVAAADAWKPKPSEVWELVHGLIEDSYDLSISYQATAKTVTVTLKDTNSSRKTAGFAISTKDANAPDALKLALWKHFNVLIRDWAPLLEQPVRPRRG